MFTLEASKDDQEGKGPQQSDLVQAVAKGVTLPADGVGGKITGDDEEAVTLEVCSSENHSVDAEQVNQSRNRIKRFKAFIQAMKMVHILSKLKLIKPVIRVVNAPRAKGLTKNVKLSPASNMVYMPNSCEAANMVYVPTLLLLKVFTE
ncbi:nuclear pore complex protein [Trifolium repens]|nr:nuclear pore complex protein [Trifolium repens]